MNKYTVYDTLNAYPERTLYAANMQNARDEYAYIYALPHSRVSAYLTSEHICTIDGVPSTRDELAAIL